MATLWTAQHIIYHNASHPIIQPKAGRQMMNLVWRGTWLELNWKVEMCPFCFNKSLYYVFSSSIFCLFLLKRQTHTDTHRHTHNWISLGYAKAKKIPFFWLTEGSTVALKASSLPLFPGAVRRKQECVCYCVRVCVSWLVGCLHVYVHGGKLV